MSEGIVAIKHNYTNDKTKKVKLYMTFGGSNGNSMKLHYQTLQPGAIECVKGAQVIDLDNILGFVIGA